MIEVEMPDGTILEFPEGTPPDVMQAQAQQYMGGAQPAPTEAQPAPQGGGLLNTVYENIIGSGEADTPGERFGQTLNEMGRAGAAGVARGVAGLADIPGMIVGGASNLASAGLERVGADPTFIRGMQMGLEGQPMGTGDRAREGIGAITGGASEYQSPTTAGQFAGTVGEFLPGAMLGGGSSLASNALRYGVLPGVASEAAGQLTEGTAAEPYARAAAAIGAPLGAAAIEKGVRRAITPLPGIDAERLKLTKVLDDFGVPVTAGQRTGSETLRRIEGSTARGAQMMDDQAEAFTAAALKSIGVDAKRATPDVIEEASRKIGGVFNSVTKGVDVAPDAPLLTKMSDALREYRELAPSAEVAPIFSNINKELVKAFRGQNSIPATTLNSWRSQLSKLTTSNSAATREAAKVALEAVDESLTKSLTALGRADDVARLSEARGQWRNLLAIEGAASRAGESTASGLLSPSVLRNEVVRQGRTGYTRGTRGGLADLTRAAEGVIKPLPTVQAGGARNINLLPTMASSGAGGAIGGMVGGPVGAVVGGSLGAAAPQVGANMAMSPAIQRYLANQAVGAGGDIFDPNVIRATGGLLAQ